MTSTIAALALTLVFGLAQDVTVPDQIEKLSARAKNSTNITLDGTVLRLAGQFLSSKDADEQRVKNLISRLKTIQVRSFEFANDGEYSEADVASYRSQLRSPAWSRLVETRKGREHLEVFVKQVKGQIAGFAIIAAEPTELTIVNIDGTIDLAQLASLSGQFGIPKIDADAGKPVAPPTSTAKPATKASAE